MHAGYLFAISSALLVSYTFAYEGSGVLTDHGVTTAHHRYVLSLGPVDLSKAWRREYVLADMPREEFTVGLRIAGDLDKTTAQAKVRLLLVNERGEKVIDVADYLRNWVWSTSSGSVQHFVYLGGVQREVPIGEGAVKLERIAVAPDEGWGTYFSPRRSGKYRLVFETIIPDPRAGAVTAELVALGGGWK